LSAANNNGTNNADIPIEDLFREDFRIYEGHNRHKALMRYMESLIVRNRGGVLSEDQIIQLSHEWNDKHCVPPLDDIEFNKQYRCAKKFTSKNNNNDDDSKEQEEGLDVIEETSESIMRNYNIVTLLQAKDILYYDSTSGVYITGGEELIEREAEKLFDYKLSNQKLSEIKGHIIRRTYRNMSEFDTDLNIINMKNGLYDIQTGEFKDHSPEYLSRIQCNVVYNPSLRPKLFGRFLSEVLYPIEIRTAIELMAYTFYRNNRFEIITFLNGGGGNGKSVFTTIITELHGLKNVSNVPLSAMLKDIFALSDLENKNVNIDPEMSFAFIHDTGILKKLTGRQPIRIQRKNQRAYDTGLHTKMFFNGNKIPESEDDSNAFHRRNIVINFPNTFEGDRDDPDLDKKLTTEDEKSAIFNVLMVGLRRLLAKQKGVFLTEKTIAQRREKYDLMLDPVKHFRSEAIAEDSVFSDEITKEDLYKAYCRFCRKKKLAIEPKETFGKKMVSLGFKSCRIDVGLGENKKKTGWKGIKLVNEYRFQSELTV
jgi:putative DNA primase/helicase